MFSIRMGLTKVQQMYTISRAGNFYTDITPIKPCFLTVKEK